jgi:hypothetical protein
MIGARSEIPEFFAASQQVESGVAKAIGTNSVEIVWLGEPNAS